MSAFTPSYTGVESDDASPSGKQSSKSTSSGALYCSEPIAKFLSTKGSNSLLLFPYEFVYLSLVAKLKSAMISLNFLSISKFSGLISLCTTP